MTLVRLMRCQLVEILGVKGVGESGTVGALPAVMNAVNDALHRAGAPTVEYATPAHLGALQNIHGLAVNIGSFCKQTVARVFSPPVSL